MFRVVIAVAAVVLCGCQARVVVDTRVELDGRGMLVVAVGLDDEAVARVSDLDRQVRLGDLAAAGWEVRPAQRGPDGLTWLRASRRFESIDELNRVLAELTGEPAVFRDFRLTSEDTATAVNHRLTGTVDAARAMSLFSDAQLADRLGGGDPVGAHVAAVERDEGRSMADMITFDVAATVAGEPGPVAHPRLDDREPMIVEALAADPKSPTSVGGGAPLGTMALTGMLVLAMFAAARQRFRTSG